jgi:hypothetical protein
MREIVESRAFVICPTSQRLGNIDHISDEVPGRTAVSGQQKTAILASGLLELGELALHNHTPGRLGWLARAPRG